MKANVFFLTFFTLTAFVTVNGQTSQQIEMEEGNAGSLFSKITEPETVTRLTVSGEINAVDFCQIRENLNKLEQIDLTNARIMAYKGKEGTHVFQEEEEVTDIEYRENELPEICLSGELEVVFPVSLKSIHSAALSWATVPKVDLSKTAMEIIPAYLFWYSYAKEVRIPTSVQEIQIMIFGHCENLKDVHVGWTTPPAKCSEKAFDSFAAENATLWVPAGTKSTYAGTDPWSKFGTITETTPTGLEALPVKPAISVREGKLFINAEKAQRLDIFNLQGQKVRTVSVSVGETVVVLAPGTYIVDGNKVVI
ncbi:MAG: leucine-rich repeat protein [Bacteroidales bacterium]